jgi:hypothetical protein
MKIYCEGCNKEIPKGKNDYICDGCSKLLGDCCYDPLDVDLDHKCEGTND